MNVYTANVISYKNEKIEIGFNKEGFNVIKRIHNGNIVKVIDEESPHFNEKGIVIDVVSKPVGMRLRNHLRIRLDSTGAEELFLPEQLKVIG